MKKGVLSLMAVLAMGMAAMASTMYVQSREAPLMQEPSFGAAVLGTFTQGSEVRVLETQGTWHRVQAEKQQGWMSRLALTSNPPLGRVGVIGAGEERLEDSVRRRTSAVVTAGAARGLTPEDRARASEMGLSNYHALAQMERLHLEEEEIIRFHREVVAP